MLAFLKRLGWTRGSLGRRVTASRSGARAGRVQTEDLVLLDPGMPAEVTNLAEVDPVTEQFRTIRANLLAVPIEKRPRVILFTSPTPGEGVTLTVQRLGAALAERGDLRVLLVDANLRDPGLDSLIEEVDGGLTEILRGDGEAIDWIRPTVTENLDLLPSGAIPGNPGELLSVPALGACLQELREAYDFVLIDTPSVGPVADAAILGKNCDSAMLVVRLKSTPREVVASTLERLAQAQVEVLGCVLTGDGEAPVSKRRYRYGEVEGA